MRHAHYTFTARHRAITTAFLVMLLSYLLFHLFLSERSIPSLLSLSLKEQRMEVQLEALTTERESYYSKVARLRPDSLDADLLEEYSIRMLGRNNAAHSYVIMDENS